MIYPCLITVTLIVFYMVYMLSICLAYSYTSCITDYMSIGTAYQEALREQAMQARPQALEALRAVGSSLRGSLPSFVRRPEVLEATENGARTLGNGRKSAVSMCLEAVSCLFSGPTCGIPLEK